MRSGDPRVEPVQDAAVLVDPPHAMVREGGGYAALWKCPSCKGFYHLIDFGLRRMEPGGFQWRRQSHCGPCRVRAKRLA